LGQDTSSSSRISDAQILKFLNTAQRKLSIEAPILLTCATTSTVASQEQYSIPGDYSRIYAVFIYNTTTGQKQRLTRMNMLLRDPQKGTGQPQYYYVWGLNVNSINSFTINLNPIPSTSGSSDLEIFYKQIPADMVAAGTAPEVMFQWQDALASYGLWKCYRRMGRDWIQMAMEARSEWEQWIQTAKGLAGQLSSDFPATIADTEGLYSTVVSG
jgi:hypothetical protein